MSVTEDVGVVLRPMEDAEVLVRRFGGARKLTGEDLVAIRSQVLGLTQTDVSIEWGYSRTYISRIENEPVPDQRIADMYLGLLFRRFFTGR